MEAGGKVKASTSFLGLNNPTSDAPMQNPSFATAPTIGWIDSIPDHNDAELDHAYIDHIASLTLEPTKRKLTAADEPIKTWVPHCDRYLAEMITLEGRGFHFLEHCRWCRTDFDLNRPQYRCEDCFGGDLLCQGCMVHTHAGNPFHRIKKWNGKFFEGSTLKSLGLRIQLGHRLGDKCLLPIQCSMDDFFVIDTCGVHAVGLDFCGCGTSGERHTIQLLRACLFPATVESPKTAATFRLLEKFELLSYESKVSVFEYYQTLSRLTDNTGMRPPKDRYPSFLRMIREWRYIRLLKRAGRGHDPAGVVATKRGECGVLCPACPHPGKNLPSGWEDVPEERRFLYALFLGMDANFCLKRKNVSSQSLDPGLGHGIAYFVEETDYKSHLEEFKDEAETKSTCSRHDAVYLSDAKPGRGHAATGVGSVECVRHGMWQPNGVGDLQKGERYCNMDYLFHNSLSNSKVKTLVVSYDIACQWSINLKERMDRFNSSFFVENGGNNIKYLVPKFHLPAHVARCQTQFSFNFTKGVGQTDGEAVERQWAEVNPLATSTREMGPGSRRDTLDCHFGDSNWRKVIGLGVSLHRRMVAAARDMAEHAIAHQELEHSLPLSSIIEWTSQIEAWESDASSSNPFEIQVDTPTQAAVRRDLAEVEARDLIAGKDQNLHETISRSVLIANGLELEGMQRSLKLAHDELWEHAQDRQHTRVQLRHNALQRKISAWGKVQELYMPAVVILRRREGEVTNIEDPEIKSYECSLWLPSQVGTKVLFDKRLAEIEWELRLAQAYEALETLRQNLRLRSYLFKFKERFVRGQGANTRTRNAIDRVQARVNASGEDYRAARVALVSLSGLLGKVGWQEILQPLADSDKREIAQGEEGTSEGRRVISWIWKTIGVADHDDDLLQDTLRVEWCKSRARAARFSEEVDLLTEEMERVLRFLEWEDRLWISKGDVVAWDGISRERCEGLVAYAMRQACLRKDLREHYSNMWKDLPEWVKRMRQKIVDSAEALPSIGSDKT